MAITDEQSPAEAAPAEPLCENGNNDILLEWLERIRHSHRAHKLAAAYYESGSRTLGIVAVVCSAIVGTTVFATLQETPHVTIKLFVGLLSVTAAVFAALQTYLNLPERAEKHSRAAVAFGDLRRRLEMLHATPPTRDQLSIIFKSVDEEWKTLNERAPIITQKLYDRAERKASNQ